MYKKKLIIVLVCGLILAGCSNEMNSSDLKCSFQENSNGEEVKVESEKMKEEEGNSDIKDLEIVKKDVYVTESISNTDAYSDDVNDWEECKGNTYQLPNSEYTMIAIDRDFYEKFSQNSIDAKWDWNAERDAASESRIIFACGYRDAWIMQIEHTLAVLEQYLLEDDYVKIMKAYKDWKLYMENFADVEQNMFYVFGEYFEEYMIGDNFTYPMVMESVAMRTKYFAVDLLALEYALTGDMELIEME